MKTYAYKVRPYDTYWRISKRQGIAIDTILSCNDPERPHALEVGTVLEIPIINGIFHRKAKGGESVESLGRSYNLSKRLIRYFNPNFDLEERIFIPGAGLSLSERTERLGYLFLKPLSRIKVTSYWGMRIHPITKKREMHTGIDLAAMEGTFVYAAKGGKVIYTGRAYGYGKLVVIQHSRRYQTKYAHLKKIRVKVGQRVKGQAPIGRVGNTGRSTGFHLHYEVLRDGKPINPLEITDLN